VARERDGFWEQIYYFLSSPKIQSVFMKLFQLLIPFTLLALIAFSSCQSSESKKVMEEARETLPQTSETSTPDNTISPVIANPGNNSDVPHYKCPDNCSGGGGPSAGTCSACGKTLVHNAAYHNQPGSTPDPAANPQTPPAQQQPSPAQNAAGVYHYTCSSGCAGGAGSAIACASCGATLVHNSAYHN
jgi:hypothetical protein